MWRHSNFGGGPGGFANYVVPEMHRGISSYTLQMGELVPSMLSTAWTTNGGSCAFWGPSGAGDGCATSVHASTVSVAQIFPGRVSRKFRNDWDLPYLLDIISEQFWS